jgi:hypothetical protein
MNCMNISLVETSETHAVSVARGKEQLEGTRCLPASSRWFVYSLLIAVACGTLLSRVADLKPVDPKSPTPFLSANDRSRWATIRALGDSGTYELDAIIFDARGRRVRGWHSIDLVRHRAADGREHYYSSKPTLLTTLLAGEYWLVKQATGATLAEQPAYVARIMLVLTNVLPLAGALVLLARLVEQFGRTDSGRIFTVTAACFATFMTTFAITLNNHLIAAISLVVALAASVPVFRDGRRAWWLFALAGLSYGFLAANELPALSLLALAGHGFAWKVPWQTLVGFLPAAALVAAGALGTNIIAHGDWRTPYAHRSNGPVVAELPALMAADLNAGGVPPGLRMRLRQANIHLSDMARVEQQTNGEKWRLYDPTSKVEYVLRLEKPAKHPSPGQAKIAVRRFDNWYDYPGSYWQPDSLRGIDRGEASPAVYAFNVLIGHHGLFSLTPIWLLSAVGAVMWLRSPQIKAFAASERLLALTTIIISVVVIGFYLSRPQIDRNYGGGTCCLRWLVWLSPLWLLVLLPAADWLGRHWWGLAIGLVLLAVSVFSATYGNDNPWSHPWIFDYWQSLGWIKY